MGSKPVPEQIADTIEESDYPELSIREVMERAGLSKGQVCGAAGSMDRLELDRSLGVVRLRDDDGGEFVDDHGQDVLPDGGSKPTFYLAGPVAAYQDGGAAWRDRIIEQFGDEFDFRNPLDKYNVPVDDLTIVDGAGTTPDDVVSVTELVETDKELLEESDGVLVGYSAVQSVGTPMEVMWAYERDIPIAVWLRDDTAYDEVSPWYRYHAGAVVDDIEDALHYLWGNVPAAARRGGY